jgi:hypothetical protein
MSYPLVCPDCGSTRLESHLVHGKEAATAKPRTDVDFARVLNGHQWREKPIAPPRYRDDVVPND